MLWIAISDILVAGLISSLIFSYNDSNTFSGVIGLPKEQVVKD